MKHVRPYTVDRQVVVAQSGRTVCPYCESQSTDDVKTDIGWVEGPIPHSPRRFICLGCCEDIYSACAADDFETHPYFDVVVEAAKKEGVTVRQFRFECLKQQLRCAEERRKKEGTDKYARRERRLAELLKSL